MAPHFDYLNTVHLLYVVAHFEALFHTVIRFITRSYHSNFITIRTEVVLNLAQACLFISHWHSSSEFNDNWFADASF